MKVQQELDETKIVLVCDPALQFGRVLIADASPA